MWKGQCTLLRLQGITAGASWFVPLMPWRLTKVHQLLLDVNSKQKNKRDIVDIKFRGSFCGWPRRVLHTSPAPLTWRSCCGCQLLLFLPSQTDTAWSRAALPHKENYSLHTNTPMGLSVLISVTAGSQGWEIINQNLSKFPLRYTLFLYSRSQGLWLAYCKAWGVLKLDQGSATRSSSSGPSSSMLENPISSWNWGQRKRRIFLGNGHVKVTQTSKKKIFKSLQQW